jgi:mRNA interferase MazF
MVGTIIAAVAETSMQVSAAVYDELAAVAAQDFGGVSVSEAIHRLVWEHKIAGVMARYEELRADPEEWASYQAELREWDAIVGEGHGDAREEYPEYNRPVGHEQGGLRPAVVVGSRTHCQSPSHMAIVVPLTSRDRGLEHHVRIDSSESGVKQTSWARTDDIRSVSTDRLVRTAALGTASASEIEELRHWLRKMVAFC